MSMEPRNGESLKQNVKSLPGWIKRTMFSLDYPFMTPNLCNLAPICKINS